MTTPFAGFPQGKAPTTALPTAFFEELLPMIDHLGELKVTLYCFWALHQREGHYRYLRYQDFSENTTLLHGLSMAHSTLDEALMRAVERGTLLCHGAGEGALYLMNTPRGREALRQLQLGTWRPTPQGTAEQVLPTRPNIYTLWEQNIGLLTPLLSDHLRQAERDYPSEWIAEAIEIAVRYNKRNWNYIDKILTRWKQEGRQDASAQQSVARTVGRLEDFIDRS
jgi:DNA replication protein